MSIKYKIVHYGHTTLSTPDPVNLIHWLRELKYIEGPTGCVPQRSLKFPPKATKTSPPVRLQYQKM